VVSQEHMKMSMYLRELLSIYESMEDMVNLGLYASGSNPAVDKVIRHKEEINSFFRQRVGECVNYGKSLEELKILYEKLRLS
ncbi:MAG: flagellum-specific ATP synthase FliI, partial [Aquificaceae bacterium]|nr:flagellum-specific ATP synthase FliI [Aquificaceae bacterium]